MKIIVNSGNIGTPVAVELARLGSGIGVDLWSYTSPRGGSLPAAIRHLSPYIDPAKPWPKKDLEAGDRGRIAPLIAALLANRPDPGLRALLADTAPRPSRKEDGEFWRLWFPEFR